MSKAILIFSMAMIAQLLGATELVVCSDCELQSLSSALETAEDGDDILIRTGVYITSEVVVEKAVTIHGEPGTVLDGAGLTILYVHHDSVSVHNIRLQNVATNYVEDRAALKCNDSDYLSIYNVEVRHSFFGIMVEKSKFGVIRNCDIQGDSNENNYLESANGNAIHLWYCKEMEIHHNRVMNHRDGIYFEFVEHSKITSNHSESNMRYGLHFMFSHNNCYVENRFEKNGAGVAVMYSSKVVMIRNVFVNNWGGSAYGLLLKDISDSELEGNVFSNNTIAISADNTTRISMHNNLFERNGYALRIMGNCNDNVITENDFLENSFDITTNARSNFNDFDGNYWEEYSGYDLDKDGVGDIPFRPVKLFTYITAQAPAAIILMRSTFIDLLNLAEKVTPVLTPESLIDHKPQMHPINDHTQFSF